MSFVREDFAPKHCVKSAEQIGAARKKDRTGNRPSRTAATSTCAASEPAGGLSEETDATDGEEGMATPQDSDGEPEPEAERDDSDAETDPGEAGLAAPKKPTPRKRKGDAEGTPAAKQPRRGKQGSGAGAAGARKGQKAVGAGEAAAGRKEQEDPPPRRDMPFARKGAGGNAEDASQVATRRQTRSSPAPPTATAGAGTRRQTRASPAPPLAPPPAGDDDDDDESDDEL